MFRYAFYIKFTIATIAWDFTCFRWLNTFQMFEESQALLTLVPTCALSDPIALPRRIEIPSLRGDLCRMWRLYFSTVNAHVSQATLKDCLLNWHPPRNNKKSRHNVLLPVSFLYLGFVNLPMRQQMFVSANHWTSNHNILRLLFKMHDFKSCCTRRNLTHFAKLNLNDFSNYSSL